MDKEFLNFPGINVTAFIRDKFTEYACVHADFMTKHLNDILLRDLCPRRSVKYLKSTIVNPGCHFLNGRLLENLIKLTVSLIGGLKNFEFRLFVPSSYFRLQSITVLVY